MEMDAITLPWNDHPVFSSGNLHSLFAQQLPAHLRYHLPVSITICADKCVSLKTVEEFLETVAGWFAYEFPRREDRRMRFIELDLFEDNELRVALTQPHAQQWVIYYSEFGGLETPSRSNPNAGIIPCSAMRNHGVAWRATGDGQNRVWLVSARKTGLDWDLDSDIGHESAHAAFAPVPLFGQALQQDLDLVQFTTAQSSDELNRNQLARMCYAFAELAVVAVRGEMRPTQTMLPIGDARELHQLLNLSRLIFPDAGFDRAFTAFKRVDGRVDMNGCEIFEIGAAALRAFSRVINFVNEPDLNRVMDKIFTSKPQQVTA